jgi:hypothetical protein
VFSKAGEINFILEKQCSCTFAFNILIISHPKTSKCVFNDSSSISSGYIFVSISFSKVSRMFNIFNLSFNKFNAVNQVYFYHL